MTSDRLKRRVFTEFPKKIIPRSMDHKKTVRAGKNEFWDDVLFCMLYHSLLIENIFLECFFSAQETIIPHQYGRTHFQHGVILVFHREDYI